jgi:hypothetical protein
LTVLISIGTLEDVVLVLVVSLFITAVVLDFHLRRRR